jgi:glycosyltransferase involved in cell wall biosynthesis
VQRPVGYVLTNFPQLSETFIENEIRALRELGDDVVAFSLYEPNEDVRGPSRLDASRLSYRPSAPVVALHFLRWFVRRPVVSLRSVGRAITLRSQTMLRGAWCAGWIASGLEKAEARHVHAHFALDAACAGRAASDLARLPFTFTLHAHELYLRNRTLCARLAMADVLVTVCQYNVRELEKTCAPISADRLEIVYCGVDPSEFVFVDRPEHAGPLRLLSVGRLVAQKGFDDLIRAVAVLRGRGRDVTCEIVGRGPLRDELRALIRQLGVEDAVTLVGALAPGAVAQRMAGSDVFVLACKIDDEGNRDSMPVVVKEAMAVGLPVVGTQEVAMPEMIDDSVGRLAPPGDAGALADAIDALLLLGHQGRRQLGLAGQARVEKEFNLFTETAKLRALFDRLAGRRQTGARRRRSSAPQPTTSTS